MSRQWKRETQAIRDNYGRGLFLTRDALDLSEDIWALPSGAFAWAIGT